MINRKDQFILEIEQGFSYKAMKGILSKEDMEKCFPGGIGRELERKTGEVLTFLNETFDVFSSHFPAPTGGWDQYRESLISSINEEELDVALRFAAMSYIGQFMLDAHSATPSILAPVSFDEKDLEILQSFSPSTRSMNGFNNEILECARKHENDGSYKELTESRKMTHSEFFYVNEKDQFKALDRIPEIFSYHDQQVYGLLVPIKMQRRILNLTQEEKDAIKKREHDETFLMPGRVVPEVEQLVTSTEDSQYLSDVLVQSYPTVLRRLFINCIVERCSQIIHDLYTQVFQYARALESLRQEAATRINHEAQVQFFQYLCQEVEKSNGGVHLAFILRTNISPDSYSDFTGLSFEEICEEVHQKQRGNYVLLFKVKKSTETNGLIFTCRDRHGGLIASGTIQLDENNNLQLVKKSRNLRKNVIDLSDVKNEFVMLQTLFSGTNLINDRVVETEKDALLDGEHYLSEVKKLDSLGDFFAYLRKLQSGFFPYMDYYVVNDK